MKDKKYDLSQKLLFTLDKAIGDFYTKHNPDPDSVLFALGVTIKKFSTLTGISSERCLADINYFLTDKKLDEFMVSFTEGNSDG